jgi:hypothetical protein
MRLVPSPEQYEGLGEAFRAGVATQCLTAGDVLDLVHVVREALPSSESPRGQGSGARLRDLAS